MIGLIYSVKRHFKFLWKLVDYCNRTLLVFFYQKKLRKLNQKLSNFQDIVNNYQYKRLELKDVDELVDFFSRFDSDNLLYFHPHDFDNKSLLKIIKSPAMVALGYYKDKKLIGYFFLRLFFTKKAFTGLIVDPGYRNLGIGKTMISILKSLTNTLGFKLYSTISRNNQQSLKTHEANGIIEIIRNLPNNYMLIKIMSIS